MSDDPNAPHYLVRDLEDDLPDLEGEFTPTYDARNLEDDAEAPSSAPEQQPDEQPEERRAPPPRRPAGAFVASRSRLPERARARGIACVVIQYTDGQRVVLS